MIDIQAIRNLITKGLYEYTGLEVIDTDNANKKPEYPFYSYKITGYNPDNFIGDSTGVVKQGKIIETRTTQPTIIVSFNCYADDIVIANEMGLKAWEWFKFAGYHKLKSNNIIVVDVRSIQDRTIFLTTDYEHRIGFDVVLRTTHTIKREVDFMDDFN